MLKTYGYKSNIPTLNNNLILPILLLLINFYMYFKSSLSLSLIAFYSLCWYGIMIEIPKENNKINKKKYIIFATIFVTILLFYKSISINDSSERFIFISILLSTFILNIFNSNNFNILVNKKILLLGIIQPIHYLFMPFITPNLQILTARLSNIYLNLFGINSYHQDIYIYLKPNAIEVNGGCSGYEQIFFTITSLIILYQIYPITNKINVFKLALVSIISPIFLNSLRIFFLSIFIFSNTRIGLKLFDFFHESFGSIIFSGLSVYLCGKLFLEFVKKEKIDFS